MTVGHERNRVWNIPQRKPQIKGPEAQLSFIALRKNKKSGVMKVESQEKMGWK